LKSDKKAYIITSLLVLVEKINGIIEEIKEEALTFLKELISIPTENPPGLNYDKIVNVVKNKLEELRIQNENFHTFRRGVKKACKVRSR
jgi:succinyl-diaminopimelate desuccinylase